MSVLINQEVKNSLNSVGVHFSGSFDGTPHAYQLLDEKVKVALDAQPTLATSPNAGVLSVLTTYIDPNLIDILFAPMRAVEVAGVEAFKGTWTDTAIALEHTGSVSSYDDYSNNGVAKVNNNYPQRQPYLYQTTTQYGILEEERFSLSKIDLAAQVARSAVFNLNKFQNKSYFYGVEGLRNYGLLNDPSLPPAILPIPTPGGDTAWVDKDGQEIYNDLISLTSEVITNSKGLIDSASKMTLGLSPASYNELNKTTQYFNKTAKTSSSQPVGRMSRASEGSVSAEFDFANAPANEQWFIQTQYGAAYWQMTRAYRTMHYFPGVRNCVGFGWY